jgi:hypothetical protein
MVVDEATVIRPVADKLDLSFTAEDSNVCAEPNEVDPSQIEIADSKSRQSQSKFAVTSQVPALRVIEHILTALELKDVSVERDTADDVPPVGVALIQVVPLDVSTLPLVPGATT